MASVTKTFKYPSPCSSDKQVFKRSSKFDRKVPLYVICHSRIREFANVCFLESSNITIIDFELLTWKFPSETSILLSPIFLLMCIYTTGVFFLFPRILLCIFLLCVRLILQLVCLVLHNLFDVIVFFLLCSISLPKSFYFPLCPVDSFIVQVFILGIDLILNSSEYLQNSCISLWICCCSSIGNRHFKQTTLHLCVVVYGISNQICYTY